VRPELQVGLFPKRWKAIVLFASTAQNFPLTKCKRPVVMAPAPARIAPKPKGDQGPKFSALALRSAKTQKHTSRGEPTGGPGCASQKAAVRGWGAVQLRAKKSALVYDFVFGTGQPRD
jgi:hypothetical protein